MTATERLRELLDERGVEWKEHSHTMPGSMAIQYETLWGQPIDNTSGKPISRVYHCRATEMGDGRLFLEAQLVTPEQAVAATLGSEREHDLEGLLRDMHAELVDWAPRSISQLWADRMEQVGVYAGWGWRA